DVHPRGLVVPLGERPDEEVAADEQHAEQGEGRERAQLLSVEGDQGTSRRAAATRTGAPRVGVSSSTATSTRSPGPWRPASASGSASAAQRRSSRKSASGRSGRSKGPAAAWRSEQVAPGSKGRSALTRQTIARPSIASDARSRG